MPDGWCGKTLSELPLPQEFEIHVVAVHDILRDLITIPDPNRPLRPSDALWSPVKLSSSSGLPKAR